MNEYILRTHNLCKKYKEHMAVNNLNLNLKKGEIYGFLGENGAGKTTTIRMIMGLIKPTSGSIEFMGKDISSNKKNFYERVGSIIEFPGFYSNLTAKENLEIHRRLMGIQGKQCIEDALKTAGILEAKNKKVKEFSLGMKQRLGIARALLHHPEILILDEPTNGLDPAGIKDVRNLILDLAKKRNITVLISSHILSEVQQLADKIGIIHKGELLEEIDFKTLDKRNRNCIKIKVSDDRKASLILEQKLNIKDYVISEKGVIRVYERLEETGNINTALVKSNITVDEITLVRDSLEDYFMKLVGGEMSA
ncbi:ABC transporter ATP-binding protein [Clostridium ganghwense]|uniref:ABC transporter ATP-binding protein n=1 Tax=Clostridium ganghwense TaxID=312089 RepID=A0ABT4CMH6_9CLOT|nr:ABC transporter ATP-binding protein [Clostridium ganghwense]MCY6369628.1 ABC transporter ATP-binding protein [Clostridium ganghwense]